MLLLYHELVEVGDFNALASPIQCLAGVNVEGMNKVCFDTSWNSSYSPIAG